MACNTVLVPSISTLLAAGDKYSFLPSTAVKPSLTHTIVLLIMRSKQAYRQEVMLIAMHISNPFYVVLLSMLIVLTWWKAW